MKEILAFTVHDIYPDVLYQGLTKIEDIDGKKGYKGCFAHKWSMINKFVYRSNIDLNFKILNLGDKYKIEYMDTSQTEFCFTRGLVTVQDGHHDAKDMNPVFQIETDKAFICKDKVFMEMQHHHSTPNNLKLITGKFDISSWARGINCAFEIKNQHQEVVIKRGDPLAVIAFYTDKINETFKIKNINPSKELLKLTRSTALLTSFLAHVKILLPVGKTLLQNLIEKGKHVRKK
tara:strand:- start:35 stop:733 length:699 start_codon:yes stop_codon:yes gene_type:complete